MNICRTAACLLAVPLTACFQPITGAAQDVTSALSPSAVIANAKGYDGQMITVSGTVSSVHPDVKKSHAEFEQYELCQGEGSERWCVSVIDLGSPALQDGQQTTASGVYHADLQGGDAQVSDVLIVKGTAKAH